MFVVLTRYYRSAVQCRGRLRVFSDGEDGTVFECKTLELPWDNNRRRESCIPPGPDADSGATYRLDHRGGEESSSFDYPHFILRGVPGRDYILIHAGNLYTQILGCILVGDTFVDLNDDGHPDVTRSRATLTNLREVLSGSRTDITIRWVDQLTGVEITPLTPETEPDFSDLPDLSALPYQDA